MTSKHPQRCSNHCVHETKSPFLYGWGCNAVRDDEGRPINITVVEERLINEIGCALYSNHLELPDSCASHSSASEPGCNTDGSSREQQQEDGKRMTHWYCYKCRRADGKSNGPCEYIDPIGEMHKPPITCSINEAEWTKEKHDEWCFHSNSMKAGNHD